MNTSLQEILIESAQRYYEYLDNNDLGLSEIAIARYELGNDELTLWLKGNVVDMDLKLGGALLLRVGEEFYSIAEGEEIESRFYDDKQKVLHLALSPHIVVVFTKAQKENITFSLLSDLKFLVKNVEDFFSKYGHKVALPKSIAFNEVPHITRLSNEQNQALSMVLTSPLSYVWGPPGTGKTQAVLFEALLYYIKQGKRVAVVATTNNALEQVLRTLIQQFDTLGLERKNILRLGTPTLRYMNEFSQTCDPSILQQKNATTLFNFQDTLKTRLKNAFVVGVTLDGFIKRYESLELKFHHIFLDECAYAPLIKTCALCIDGTPLSFFGDHKQLSPVCEMPPRELNKAENENAYLWNLSALFIESLGTPIKETIKAYQQTCDIPTFTFMRMSKLSRTHRYGDNLAHILDEYIYHIGLKGNDEQMEILVLDSGSKSEQDKHLSENEARACEQLCAKLKGADYAVITPFVKQRQRLTRQMSRERIFTIHSAQGQEFDNVIFSPVSLHYHLTDSRQTHALYALNVAISRTKKRLFIVCDYAFWSRQRGQLICSLLQSAQKINNF
ncbi:AAA domain-containing protein [Helicobacter sp. MIT 21-1697]|uniref:AAA domain-containing protein n=1 Tax=Helicobacter sp. MIT 21-1697 TaxID=2993733 RepID=UPI00224B8C31|nr:AAA domain-containing protein [Helicobacter sp. MIT 21-1697]MCX2717373.1 AAA domain-containing protein [Helicobacter sp. MIT 21-1697]